MAIHAMHEGDLRKAYDFSVEATNLSPKWNHLTMLAQLSIMITFETRKLTAQGLKCAKDAALVEPNNIRVWIVMGNCNLLMHNYQESIAAYTRAMELAEEGSEDMAKIKTGLGHAYDKTGNKRKAIKLYEDAIRINPDDKHTAYLLGTRYIDEDWDPIKMAYYSECGIGGPDNEMSTWNAALANLALGNYALGWQYHEIRKTIPEFDGVIVCQQRFPGKKEWDGKTIERVHVIREQGLGDSLQFVRYLKLLTATGCKVQMEVNDSMIDLYKHSFPDVQFFPMTYEPSVPEFDSYVYLMSLPHMLSSPTLSQIPYLKAEPSFVAKWEERCGKKGRTPLIGVVWAGERRSHDGRCHQLDSQRSMSWDTFKPIITNNPDIDFVCLQLGDPLKPALGQRMIFPSGIESFSDTAGIMEHCDAIISVDTAPAHLAGAMGKKVYLLDKYATCWRWPHQLDEYGSTVWYPSMHIIRQKRYMDWSDVIERMNDELMVFKTPNW
jgi:tetratricopeptide (TPR) repeat protein